MATELVFEHTCSNTEATTFVEWLAGHIQTVINVQIKACGMAAPTTVVITLADDFVGEVAARSGGKEADFTLERIGGQVTGKNLDHPTREDWGQVILNAQAIDYTDSDNGGQLYGAFILAHELWHPPLTWTSRAASPRTPSTGQSPVEAARAMARVLADEYRADVMASIVLDVLAGPEAEHRAPGKRRKTWLAETHHQTARGVLTTTVHPGWPDTIEAYRTYDIDLMTMWNTILKQTNELLILLAHAEAAANSADASALMSGELAELPGSQLYISDLWDPIAQKMVKQPLTPGVQQCSQLENELADITEDAVLRMWGKLGLTFSDMTPGSDQCYIHVADPAS